MGSVWKRIQRVGKRASKFQFIASYQTLTLECSRDGKWQPNKLSVIWSRRSKRKAIKGETWQPSIANPFRGMIVWTDPEEIEITVTLYKDARDGSPFEDKLWTFVIEDEAVSGKRRPVASVSVNMVDYHSIDLQTFCLNLPLRPATKKVVSASLELNLGCVLLKEGNAMDEDMISMSSLMSLSDPYGSRDFEDSGKNFKRNTHKRLSLRSGKSKNKPTFNLASPNTGSPKPKKVKHRGKTPTSELLNSTFPAEMPANGLKKPLSTSDTDLSRRRQSPLIIGKKQESKSAAEEELLKWCQECVKDYEHVTVTNMTTSWRNGLAFCAIVHHFNPDMIDFSKLKPDDIRENNRLAFEAFDYLGISRILDPHQMVLASKPDKLLVMTYLHQIKQHFTTKPQAPEDEDQINELTLAAISEVGKKLSQISENTIADFTRNQEPTNLDSEKEKAKEMELDSSKNNELQYETKPGYNPFEDEPEETSGINEVSLDDVHLDTEVSDIRTTEAVLVEELVTEHKEICDTETTKTTKANTPSDLDLTETKPSNDSVVYSPKPGYNPFLDDEDLGVTEKESSTKKEPLNPFDDGYDENVLEQTTEPEKSISTKLDESSSKSIEPQGAKEQPDQPPKQEVPQVTKPRSLNPFDDDYEEPVAVDGGSLDDGQKKAISEPVATIMAKTTTSSSTKTSSLRTGIAPVSKIPTRRPPERPSTLDKEPTVRKPRQLNKPEPLDILKRKGGLPESPRSDQSSPHTGPTSPRNVMPSFAEWKAQKSDDVAKQEQRKAQARQMIKEARAKNAKSQVTSNNETQHNPSTSSPKQHPRTNVAVTSNLPKLTTPPKKYRAPEPPSQVKEGNLASKLKTEIEFQKKITEKTRRTLESSRIKRINPKQETVPTTEVRSERSEKVQQAINDARKPKTSDASKLGVTTNETETPGGNVVSPPKPPRVYTYTQTDDTTTTDVSMEATKEKYIGEGEDQTDSGVDVVEVAKTSEEESNSSLQQNPFKLTIKRKDVVPQAVVKPMSVTTAGKDTKIVLKKYSSVRSRKLADARVDGLSDGKRKHRKSERSEDDVAAGKDKYSGHLSGNRGSLSDGQQSSEEDVNDILDNIATSSKNDNKTDDELLHYDNAGEEEDFQDTSQYVEHEIATLEEDRIALDRVAVKLEKELRDAMNTADCKEEEQRLFQEWFLLVNKRNEIVRRQTELSILEKEEDLEKRFELLNRELRFLMSDNSRDKTPQEQKREELLLKELVILVNKRDELVRIEDSQVQQAEKTAKQVEHIVRNTRIPKKQSDCSIQ